ncbi:hypothetical protein APHAL10511_004041 [Amanita phalloides]|nr:hypothetical protein APHAL10511_004041 [Amanita phalloides]
MALDIIQESEELEDDFAWPVSQASMDYNQYQTTIPDVPSPLVHHHALDVEGDELCSGSSDDEVEVWKPRHKPTGKVPRRQKPSSKAPSRQGSDNESDSEYDLATCVFKIPSAVKNPDGSNSPFTIESSISLEDLHNDVAEKLGRHPRVIQLWYKLTSNKAKAPATSIQSDEELEIFMDQMRVHLVPPRLANGKCSKRAPKNITICFEDAAAVEGKKAESSDGKGKKMSEPAEEPAIIEK